MYLVYIYLKGEAGVQRSTARNLSLNEMMYDISRAYYVCVSGPVNFLSRFPRFFFFLEAKKSKRRSDCQEKVKKFVVSLQEIDMTRSLSPSVARFCCLLLFGRCSPSGVGRSAA